MLIPTWKAAYPGSASEASLTAHNPSTARVFHIRISRTLVPIR
jgi:hypothetical protein